MKIFLKILLILIFLIVLFYPFFRNNNFAICELPSSQHICAFRESLWWKIKKAQVAPVVQSLGSKKNTLNDCPGVTPEVEKLFTKNNIDLSRLSAINPEASPILLYTSQPSGYTYKVSSHRTEKVFDGMLDHIRLNTCYNGRFILTDELQFSFIDGIFRSAFDSDFVPISISPYESISLEQAKKISYREQPTLKGVSPMLGYYDVNASKSFTDPDYILAWEFREGADVVIDAHTGKVIRSFDGIIIN